MITTRRTAHSVLATAMAVLALGSGARAAHGLAPSDMSAAQFPPDSDPCVVVPLLCDPQITSTPTTMPPPETTTTVATPEPEPPDPELPQAQPSVVVATPTFTG
jgi:hypothetical protein